MKEIKAVIQQAALENVLLALRSLRGLPGCTVSHVHGYQRSGPGSSERELEHEERVKVELVVKDGDAQRVVAAIAENARTGSRGDGKIFVMECLEAVQIRTGERGEKVL